MPARWRAAAVQVAARARRCRAAGRGGARPCVIGGSSSGLRNRRCRQSRKASMPRHVWHHPSVGWRQAIEGKAGFEILALTVSSGPKRGANGRPADPSRHPPSKELKIVATATSSGLLRVEGVTVRFGGITALDKVSFVVPEGHIVGLIGPNGAGKTTLFNCLSRLYSFSEGRILFEGRPLVDTPAHGIASLGSGRCRHMPMNCSSCSS